MTCRFIYKLRFLRYFVVIVHTKCFHIKAFEPCIIIKNSSGVSYYYAN
jgi:hypothetical protein